MAAGIAILAPRIAIRKKGVRFGNPKTIRRESGDSSESANRFARIGPSKMQKLLDFQDLSQKFTGHFGLETFSDSSVMKLRTC